MANILSGLFQKRASKEVLPLGAQGQSVWSWFQGLFTGSKSIHIDEEAVLTITPAWRAIDIISDVLATSPLGLYEKEKDGDVMLKEDHRLHKLIATNPSPLYTSYQFIKTWVVNTLLNGNGLARIYRDGTGVAVALEIIEYKQLIDIFLNDTGQSLSYVYIDKKNIQRTVHSDDMLHLKRLSLNGLAAVNITKTHKDTLATEAAMRDYVKSYMEKGAFLSGVVEHPTALTDLAYKKIKASWNDAFGGSQKAGGTAFLEGGAKYVPIQQNIQQSGFEQVSKKSVSDQSRIYGVPAYMLDPDEKPTYGGTEQMAIDFKKYTIEGWATNIKQELTRKLIPSNSTGRLFFDYDLTELTSGDMKTTAEYHQRYFNMSVFSADEIRGFLKRNKVPLGDRRYIQGNNMIPVEMVDEFLAKGGQQDKGELDMNTVKEDA